MIKGMHTNEGGAVVIGGHRVIMLPACHDLASYMDAAANDECATRPRWMSIASRCAFGVALLAILGALLSGCGVLS